MKNFKDIIAPIQSFMMKNGQCVGCGQQLKNAKREENSSSISEKVICKCGRIYIYNNKDKKYRRALLNEI